MDSAHPFRSFFMGGFECATHRRRDGRRLDLLKSTAHDQLAEGDYRRLRAAGLRTVRDGLRWHIIEARSGRYDWASFLPMLEASRRADVQVIWDLCHYGWPDELDIWSPRFVDRFARFAGAAAHTIRQETDTAPWYCLVNEISFWAWAGGEVGHINPGAERRGSELKRQLVRACIEAIGAIRAVDARARFVYAEPAIYVTTYAREAEHRAAAESYRLAQYETYDLISGRIEPELGGQPDYLDIVGMNFYPDNQWIAGGERIPFGHHAYRPFREMIGEAFERYRRPILITETGAEGSAKAPWLHYVCAEARAALAHGVPLLGICLYPILDHAGWDNERLCEVGLLSAPDAVGRRRICEPLLEEIQRQQILFGAMLSVPASQAAPVDLKLVREDG